MRNKAVQSLIVFTLSTFAVLLAAWAISPLRAENVDRGNRDFAFSQQSKTLLQRAEQGDTAEDVREGHSYREFGDLRLLAKYSDVIVFGKTLQEDSYFSSDDEIQTRYQVEVVRVIKNGTAESVSLWLSLGKQVAAPVHTPLSVYRFGGTVRINGQIGSHRSKGSEPLGPGNTYVLFLQ